MFDEVLIGSNFLTRQSGCFICNARTTCLDTHLLENVFNDAECAQVHNTWPFNNSWPYEAQLSRPVFTYKQSCYKYNIYRTPAIAYTILMRRWKESATTLTNIKTTPGQAVVRCAVQSLLHPKKHTIVFLSTNESCASSHVAFRWLTQKSGDPPENEHVPKRRNWRLAAAAHSGQIIEQLTLKRYIVPIIFRLFRWPLKPTRQKFLFFLDFLICTWTPLHT